MYALVCILLDIISNCSNNNKTTLVAIDFQSVVIWIPEVPVCDVYTDL